MPTVGQPVTSHNTQAQGYWDTNHLAVNFMRIMQKLTSSRYTPSVEDAKIPKLILESPGRLSAFKRHPRTGSPYVQGGSCSISYETLLAVRYTMYSRSNVAWLHLELIYL